MLSQDEFRRLARLLNNLRLCTGIKFALMDENGHEVYSSSDRAAFCSAIINESSEKCYACDRQCVEEVLRTHQPRRYLCHAGLYEAAMPVIDNGKVAAIILFGQILDDTPREEQWHRVKHLCHWHPYPEELHQAFLHLRRISEEQMEACMEIARACVSEVRLHGLKSLENRDDALQLKLYIDTHYAEPLTTNILADALHVGKTKLYAVCEKRFRVTPMQMVTLTRIEAAKELITSTNESIKSVSQTVGFSNQNYFTKLFRKITGFTPLQYRKDQLSHQKEPAV